MDVSIETPKTRKEQTALAIDAIGAALHFKLVLKVCEKLSQAGPEYVAPMAVPAAAATTAVVFGAKVPIRPQIFKACCGTACALAAAELALRVAGDARRDTAAV